MFILGDPEFRWIFIVLSNAIYYIAKKYVNALVAKDACIFETKYYATCIKPHLDIYYFFKKYASLYNVENLGDF